MHSEMNRYTSIAIPRISTACPTWFRTVPPKALINSGYPIAVASEEFLVKLRYWLMVGGIATVSYTHLTLPTKRIV